MGQDLTTERSNTPLSTMTDQRKQRNGQSRADTLPGVQAYYLRAPHFASHSGYELAVQGVADTSGIVGVGQQWPRRPVEGTPGTLLLQKMARGAQRAVGRLAGNAEYSTGGLALELSAIMRMRRSHNGVFHFLYAENACRITPLFDGWRGHRVVGTFHQTPEQLEETLGRPAYLRRLSAAIMLGRTQERFLGRFLGSKKLHFISHGVDSAYFHPVEREQHDPPLCVSIGGTLRDFKKLRGAIRILEARHVAVQYDFIARGDQLPYVEDVPGARVRTWVDEEEFLRLYQQADVFVLPLYDVVASNTLLEALACGAPTVVTDVGAVRDYVDDDCVAFARPHDAESLADAMELCLRDATYARQLSARGRARAEAVDVGRVAALHRNLYQSLKQRSHV